MHIKSLPFTVSISYPEKKVITKHNVYAKGNYLEKNYLNNLEGTEKQQKGGLQIRFWKVQHEQGACQ